MLFTVRFVHDHALPEGHDWILGITDNDERFLFVKRSAVSPRVLEEAWAGGIALQTPHPLGLVA